MANPYRDAQERFTSPGKLIATVHRAGVEGDVTTYLAEKEALKQSAEASNYSTVVSRNLVIPAVLQNVEADIAERDRVLETGDYEQIHAWVDERVNNEGFRELINERDYAKSVAKELHGKHRLLLDAYKANPDIIDHETVRQKGFETLEAYETLQVLKAQVNEYKDITAAAVAVEAELAREAGAVTVRTYDAPELNDLRTTGEFPSGSREWLEQRQNGIGGSDVGKIVGSDKEYASRSYQEVLESKVEPISNEEVAEQAEKHSEFTGYTGRGNAWEEAIVNRYAANHPEDNVTHCKSSWQHKDRPYQFANFDGLMADENGVPNGILEIKTASDSSKWGATEDGLDAVPPSYRAQALWYADAAGFDRGCIAVMIDDHEYREYHFKVDARMRAEMVENRGKVEAFVKKVEAIKKGELSLKGAGSTVVKGFSTKVVSDARLGHDRAFTEAAIWREESVADTKARFDAICRDKTNQSEVRRALRALYAEKDPATRKKPFIAVDLETSGTTPTSGRIIEVGISVRKPEGGEKEAVSKLYGIPKKALAGNGTGAVNVHQITPGMIAKKRQFSHPAEQQRILGLLKSGVLEAHNAPFELGWFRQHLDGFAEAERKGEIVVLDTRSISAKLVTETGDNKLESFVKQFGGEYKDAHRAYNDAAMMAETLEKFAKKLHQDG